MSRQFRLNLVFARLSCRHSRGMDTVGKVKIQRAIYGQLTVRGSKIRKEAACILRRGGTN